MRKGVKIIWIVITFLFLATLGVAQDNHFLPKEKTRAELSRENIKSQGMDCYTIAGPSTIAASYYRCDVIVRYADGTVYREEIWDQEYRDLKEQQKARREGIKRCLDWLEKFEKEVSRGTTSNSKMPAV